mgnify:CR=1 FL=1
MFSSSPPAGAISSVAGAMPPPPDSLSPREDRKRTVAAETSNEARGSPLTTVAQPMREIGRGCVRLLLQILRGEAVESMSITLPHKLTIRASTALSAAHCEAAAGSETA